jgi:diguanylate cyclase (GGDEF)-like protein
MVKKTTYAKLTAKIIFTTLFFTLISAYMYGEYMKKEAIANLAHIDAKKTSKLVFEALYSEMQRGWNKDDIHEVISRLNQVDPTMKINIYRSKVVANIFGEIPQDKYTRETDKNIKEAMQGVELLKVIDLSTIRYDYPLIAKDKCLKCHTNAKESDVLGVIEITYPINDLKISLSKMIGFFIIFIILFSIIVFLALFFELNRYLIKPIKKFSYIIKSITKFNDMTKRVELDDNIEEINSIKDTFNSMLDSIEHQFFHDPLTGLQNRRKLTEVLEQQKSSFLMIINIDAFQEINDLYGDQVGDLVLKEFALFLKENVLAQEMLYRLHSDEFAYLCRAGMDLKEFMTFASMLSEKIAKKSFSIDAKGEVSLTATIGISYGMNSLLTNADIALSLAKKSRKNYLVYEDSMAMAKEYEKNINWTKRLKKAIDEDRIVPLFQPIVDVKTQQIVKYEALIRMVDDDGKYIAPIHFLELAKKNKLYHQLTKIMIEKSFQKFKDLSYAVSINLSVEDIRNKEINALGDRVVFEILESDGIENFDEVLEFINNVKQYGVKIAIDDFGTGYSNFDYLMKLKIDFIKIDGSMIKNIDTDNNSQMITQTIVEFAKRMKIKTIAEFVCSKDVFEKIKELDVDFAQGYYFGAPKEL